jgi:hypothetical protein
LDIDRKSSQNGHAKADGQEPITVRYRESHDTPRHAVNS